MYKSQVNIALIVLLSVFIDNTMSGTADWKPLELQFQNINKLFINLEGNAKRLFTEHFNKVYKYVTESMGELDDFFTKVFQRQQLAGSYAGLPNEFLFKSSELILKQR